MFELATTFIALFSAGIFLAHAVEAITPNEKRGTDAEAWEAATGVFKFELGKYPPAKPRALGIGPLKAAVGTLTRP